MMIIAAVVIAAAIAASFYHHSRISKRLTDKDTIVLADFANTTGDPVFDDTLKQALTVDLQQSPFLNVLSDEKTAETLKLMNLSPQARQTQEVAREICQRTGSKAMLAGSIAGIGSHFAIALKAINCQSGDSLGATEAEAESREKVLGTVGHAATELRAKLGESLTSIQKFDKPLEQVTTSSLEALKTYTEAGKVSTEKGDQEALPFLKRAIELDPNFAVAYLDLGTSYSNLNQDSLARENLKKAYQLSGRVSQREKYEIASQYYTNVTGELENAVQQYELLIHDFPRDPSAHSNLAYTYAFLGQHEKSAALDREEIQINPEAPATYANLISEYLILNRLDEAAETARQGLGQWPDNVFIRARTYMLGFLKNDADAMKQQVDWARGKPAAEDALLSLQSDTEAYYGHVRKAQQVGTEAMESAKHNGAAEVAATYEADMADWMAKFGSFEEASRLSAAALSLFPNDQFVRLHTALTFALAGELARAKQMADQLNRDFPLDTMVQTYWLPSIRAAIELKSKNAGKAIELLQPAIAYELGVGGGDEMLPPYIRGLAYLAAHDGKAAAAEFQKLLDHRGIVFNAQQGALAHLQIARAYAMAGDSAGAKNAYQDFLAIWKDADPDVPVLKEANAEYRKLE